MSQKFSYDDVLQSSILLNEYNTDIKNYKNNPNNNIYMSKIISWSNKFENIEYIHLINWIDNYDEIDPITLYKNNKQFMNDESESSDNSVITFGLDESESSNSES